MHDPLGHGEPLHLLVVTAFGRKVILQKPRFSQTAFVQKGPPPPENGVDPEEEKCPRQKGDHEDIGPVKRLLPLIVCGIGMGVERNKTFVDAFMARLAGPIKIVRMEGRSGIGFGQIIVAAVTVGASGNPLGVTDIQHFPVVGLVKVRDRSGGETVPFGHFRIGMAGPATPRIGLTGRRNISFLGKVVCRDIMETVTIGASRRVLIALGQSPAVSQEDVTRLAVATAAIFRNGCLKIFSGFPEGVNLPVTILAGEVLLNGMDIPPVFRGDIPVTGRTVYGSRALASRHVTGQIPDIRMAARATVISVNGAGKPFSEGFFRMAGLAGRAGNHARSLRRFCRNGKYRKQCQKKGNP